MHLSEIWINGGVWGLLPAGTRLQKIESLFPRIEKIPTVMEKVSSKQKKQGKEKIQEKKDEDGLITFEQFQTVDVRVAEIACAERIKKFGQALEADGQGPGRAHRRGRYR